MSKDILLERIKELEESLNHLNDTLEGYEEAEYAIQDVLLASQCAEIGELVGVLKEKLDEFNETVMNFNEIQETVSKLYETAKA